MDASLDVPTEDRAPFQVICPTCGRDSDAEEAAFFFVLAVPFFGSECLLAGLTCGACGTRMDRALWPVDTEALAAAVGEESEPSDPETVALRARYDRAVAHYRHLWERYYAARTDGRFGERIIDLSEASVTVLPTLARKTVADMRVLAGLRRRAGRWPCASRARTPPACSSPGPSGVP